MPECSLCKGDLPQDGGAILFTDGRGVPFEICGKCEGAINLLRDSTDEAEIEGALKYVSGCAESNIEYRDTYETLFGFLKKEETEEASVGEVAENEVAEQPEVLDESGEDVESVDDALELVDETVPGADKAVKRKFWPAVIVIVVVGLLVLVYVLGGFHIG